MVTCDEHPLDSGEVLRLHMEGLLQTRKGEWFYTLDCDKWAILIHHR